MIRRTSREGAELVAFYLSVLRGEPFALPGLGRRQHPTLDQRLVAAAWRADRGWGRAREIIELAGEPSAEARLAILKRLSEPDRETPRAILTRALDAPPAGREGKRDDAPTSRPPELAEPASLRPRPCGAPPPAAHPAFTEPTTHEEG